MLVGNLWNFILSLFSRGLLTVPRSQVGRKKGILILLALTLSLLLSDQCMVSHMEHESNVSSAYKVPGRLTGKVGFWSLSSEEQVQNSFLQTTTLGVLEELGVYLWTSFQESEGSVVAFLKVTEHSGAAQKTSAWHMAVAPWHIVIPQLFLYYIVRQSGQRKAKNWQTALGSAGLSLSGSLWSSLHLCMYFHKSFYKPLTTRGLLLSHFKDPW